MIAADLGRAALIASIPVAFAFGALTMPQLYVVGFLSGSLAVVVRPVVEHALRRGHAARALRRGDVAAQRQPVARLRRRPDDRRPARPGPRRAAGDAHRRAVVPRLGRLPAPDRVAGAADRARGRDDPRAARWPGSRSSCATRSCARRCCRSPRSTCSTSRSRALFILYATTTLGVSPGVARPGPRVGAVGGVIGASSRRGSAGGSGSAGLRARLLHLPGRRSSSSRSPARTCRCRSSSALIFASEFGAGLGVMILDINVGAIIYARTPDRIRAGPAARSGSSTTACGRSARCSAALLGDGARRPRGALSSRRSPRSSGSCCWSARRSCGLRDLPDASE